MGLSDAKLPDGQAGLESAMGATLAVLGGVNMISGPGMLNFESCQSLEKLVIDHEICGMALRLARGMAVRDEPIASTIISDGLTAGHFMSLPHTRRWFREEAYYPGAVIDRTPHETWEAAGSMDSLTRASQEVERILGTHQPEPLPDEVRKELEEIIGVELKAHGAKLESSESV
jgi:trimethylamine--corrinoid protein Co-methyltransferase